MKTRLFELDSKFARALDAYEQFAEENGGEIDPELEKKLTEVELEREKLALNYGRWLVNNKAEIAKIDSQIDRLKAMKKPYERDIKFAEFSLSQIVQIDEKLSDDVVQIKWSKGKSVDYIDETEIPEEYIRKHEIKYDGMRIRRELLRGLEVPGCELKENAKISVK